MVLFLKKLPWLSLTLVLVTYSVFGWILSQENLPDLAWLAIVTSMLILIAGITSPWSKTIKYIRFLFNTKLKSFLLAVLGAFTFFLILAHFRIFLDIMLILSATILVRLDFQLAGLKDIQAFYITTAFSFIGLFNGYLLYHLIR